MSDKFNFANSGAVVGVQAGKIVITGGLVVSAEGVSIQGQVTVDDEPAED